MKTHTFLVILCLQFVSISFAQTGMISNAPDYTLLCDGINDFITVPYHSDFDVQAMTIECWVKFRDIETSGENDNYDFFEQVIATKGIDNQAGTFHLFERRDDNKYYIGFEAGQYYSGNIVISSQLNLVSGQWYHVAGTYDGNTLRVFLNGVNVGSKEIGSYSFNNNSNLYFGYNPYAESDLWKYYLNGYLKDIRLWSTARNEGQIKETMYEHLTDSPGLISSWCLDTQGEQIVPDVASEHHGYLGSSNTQDENDPVWTETEGVENYLRLLSPNGGEAILAGGIASIEWSLYGINSINIKYSTDNGMTWNLVTESVDAKSGSFLWSIPEISSDVCLLKISDESDFDSFDISDEVFTIYKDGPHALLFDGVDDVAYYVNRNYMHPETLTFEFWVEFSDINNAGVLNSEDGMYYQYILSVASYGNGGYSIYQRRASWGHVLVFQLSTKKMVSPNLELKSDVWYHVACTYDGEMMRMYLNSELIQQESFVGYDTSDIIHSSMWPKIGTDYYNDKYYFNGLLDELRYWSYARSQKEIQETMNREVYIAQSLISAWHFNEGQGEFSINSANSMNELPVVLAGAYGNEPLWVGSTAPVSGLRVVYPNGGERFRLGTEKTIRWEYDKNITLSILFSANGGLTWDIIAKNISSNDQSYCMKLPNINSDSCLVKIVDESENLYFDQTDSFFTVDEFVGVDERTPLTFNLMQNYPNPFNPSTTISFSLPEESYVKLAVYNLSGQKITTLVDSDMPAGTHQVIFDGSNLSSGVYFYRVETGAEMRTGKMLFLK